MEQPQITSLVITKRSGNFWSLNVNESPQGDEIAQDAYRGGVDGQFITIKAANGAILVHQVPFSVVQYIDTLDNANSLLNPQSPLELMAHLQDENFFIGNINDGSGSGDSVTFKSLTDVAVNSFLGLENYILQIDSNGQYIIAVPNTANTLKLQQLQNYLNNDYFPPDSYIITGSQTDVNGNATGFGIAPILNLIDRPAEFNEPKLYRKGYVYIDGVFTVNQEVYIAEIGDYFNTIIFNESGYPILYEGRWRGGDMTDLNNFTWGEGEFYPLPGEPGYES